MTTPRNSTLPGSAGAANRTPLDDRPSLPVEGAFVVRLRPGTDLGKGAFAGRVEHVATATAGSFTSVDELLAFIARMLATGGETAL